MSAPTGRWSFAGDGVDVRNVPLPVASASYSPWTRGGWLLGYSIAEATGAAPATVNIYDGQDATGVLIASHTLDQSASVPVPPRVPGWPITIGVFLDIVDGSITGSITVGTLA